MRTELKCRTLYKYSELDEAAQERARDWWRQGGLDYEWYDFIYEDAKEIAALMGVEIDRIFFRGFSSQGDGACFEGSYYYKKGALKAVQSYAPNDNTLHGIAANLQEAQRKAFYGLYAHVKHSGHHYHEYCTSFDVRHDERDVSDDEEDVIKEALRDFMRWIYIRLEKEYDWLLSDESVVEAIEANEYEFEFNGLRALC